MPSTFTSEWLDRRLSSAPTVLVLDAVDESFRTPRPGVGHFLQLLARSRSEREE